MRKTARELGVDNRGHIEGFSIRCRLTQGGASLALGRGAPRIQTLKGFYKKACRMPQSSATIYLHVVFSTKGREPFLSDVGLRRDSFGSAASAACGGTRPAAGKPDRFGSAPGDPGCIDGQRRQTPTTSGVKTGQVWVRTPREQGREKPAPVGGRSGVLESAAPAAAR